MKSILTYFKRTNEANNQVVHKDTPFADGLVETLKKAKEANEIIEWLMLFSTPYSPHLRKRTNSDISFEEFQSQKRLKEENLRNLE